MQYPPVSEYQVFPRFDDDFNEVVRLIITKIDREKKVRSVVKDIIWEDIPINSATYVVPLEPQPLRLHKEETQALMDRLWSIGFRPTEAAGSAGSLAAVQYHLKMAIEDKAWLMKMVEKQISVPLLSPTIGEIVERGRK